MKNFDNHNKFWIHRLDSEVISQIDEEKVIASQNRKSANITKLRAGDRIIFVAKFDNSLEFFAYTQVDELFQNNKKIFDYYSSRRKLKLKGIKYFAKPISIGEFTQQFDFIIDKEHPSRYFNSEYREITKDEFSSIYKKANLIKEFPSYLEEVNMTLKEFIINTIHSVYNFVKHYEKRKQIEIKSFIKILKAFLDSYGIKKSIQELQDFYSIHAIELGFRHVPSRDLDKFVPLYLSTGEKKNFAYISLE